MRVQQWWHAYGRLFDEDKRSDSPFMLLVLGPTPLGPKDLDRRGTPIDEATVNEAPYLTSWNHEPSGQEKDQLMEESQLIHLKLRIENHYELYDMVVTHPEVDVPIPPMDDESDDYSDWAYEHIMAATGSGRTKGDSSYFVEVVGSSHPQFVPVGTEFEF